MQAPPQAAAFQQSNPPSDQPHPAEMDRGPWLGKVYTKKEQRWWLGDGLSLDLATSWVIYPCIVEICHIHNVPGEILRILSCRTLDILQTDRSEGYWLENDLLLRAWLLDFHNIPWERQRRYLHGVDCKCLNSLTIHPWGWLGARRESHRISNFTRFQNLIIEFSFFWVVYQSLRQAHGEEVLICFNQIHACPLKQAESLIFCGEQRVKGL